MHKVEIEKYDLSTKTSKKMADYVAENIVTFILSELKQ